MKELMIRSILAGIAIAIGGIVYGLIDQKIFAGIFFSVGIFLVIEYDLFLFTSFVPKSRTIFPFPQYISKCISVFIGNFIGAALVALIIMPTRIYDNVLAHIAPSLEFKMSDSYLGLFIMSIFCGVIIAAISKAKKFKNNPIYIIILIGLFIVCGFDHVVANCFYLVLTKEILTLAAIPFLLITLLGNFLGGFAFSFMDVLNDDPFKGKTERIKEIAEELEVKERYKEEKEKLEKYEKEQKQQNENKDK